MFIPLRYFLSAEGRLLHYVGRTLLIVVVIVAAFFLSRLVHGLISYYGSRSKGSFPNTIVIAILRIIIFLLCLLSIFQLLGIPVAPILTALGVGGLAVALALQDTLGNLFAGIQILAADQIRTGDFIKLDSMEEGFVRDVSWRNTTIETMKGNMVVIPNSKISAAIITNYHLPHPEMNVVVEVGVAYGSDLDRVEALLIEIARSVSQRVEGAVSDFEPVVRFKEFGQSSIDCLVVVRVRDYGVQFLIKTEIIREISREFEKNNIEIPFPCRSVYIRQNT